MEIYIWRDILGDIYLERYIWRDIFGEIYLERYIRKDIFGDIYLERYILSVQLVTDFKNKSCPEINAALCPVIVKSPQIKEEPQVGPPARRLNLLTIFSRSPDIST